MATAPSVSRQFAQTELFNGPSSEANRVDIPASYETAGFVWGAKLPVEVLNGALYNFGEWIAYLEDYADENKAGYEAVAATFQAFLDSDTWTIGLNDTDSKSLFAGSHEFAEEGANPYIVWKAEPDPIDPANPEYLWYAKDNAYSEEYPLNPERYDLMTPGEVRLLANEQIELYHSAGVNYTVDVRDLAGNQMGAGVAVPYALGIAQVSGQVEGDTMTLIWDEGQLVGTGNGSTWISQTAVNIYTYTSGVWV